jgi:hypothetical protein
MRGRLLTRSFCQSLRGERDAQKNPTQNGESRMHRYTIHFSQWMDAGLKKRELKEGSEPLMLVPNCKADLKK